MLEELRGRGPLPRTNYHSPIVPDDGTGRDRSNRLTEHCLTPCDPPVIC